MNEKIDTTKMARGDDGATLSRRNFLAGSLLAGAGAVVAGTLAGCAPSSPQLSSTAQEEGAATDWLGEAPGYAVEDCAKTIEADVVVLGGALSGSTAAYTAVRNNASVAVVERNAAAHIGGQEISFLNAHYQLENGVPEYSPNQVITSLFRETGCSGDIHLMANWAFNSGDLLDDWAANFFGPYDVYHDFDFAADLYPDPTVEMTQYISTGVNFSEKTDAMDQLIDKLHQFIEDHGGQFYYQTRGEKLVQGEGGRVTGVIASDESGELVYFKADKGVIVCTGSFGGNGAMLDTFYPPEIADWAKDTNSYNMYMDEAHPVTDDSMDDGLGHKMMCWAGAQMDNQTAGFMGWQHTGYLAYPFLAVNNEGARFYNECTSLLVGANVLMRQPSSDYAMWQILDSSDFVMPSVFGIPYEAFEPGGAFGNALDTETYTADTIDELAEQMGIEPAVLQATVARYNEMCKQGFDSDFGKLDRYLHELSTPPFKALKSLFTFKGTITGVACDKDMRVLDGDRHPIEGLYAAGNTVGYRYRSAYETVLKGGSNGFAATHAWVAVRHMLGVV